MQSHSVPSCSQLLSEADMAPTQGVLSNSRLVSVLRHGLYFFFFLVEGQAAAQTTCQPPGSGPRDSCGTLFLHLRLLSPSGSPFLVPSQPLLKCQEVV